MANDKLVYSRDEVVSELTSFYEFLVGLHLPASVIKYPPPGGWPNITPERLASAVPAMKKNNDVLDLIRHIPFVRQEHCDESYEIYEKTTAVDYNGVGFRGAPVSGDPIEEITIVPAHVMTLATTPGGREGYYFFIDTERGTITIMDFQQGPRPTELTQGKGDHSEEEWRDHAAYSVKDFFEMLKEEFRSLEVIPTEPNDVRMISRCNYYDMDRLKDVYRTHGWGTNDYRKEECMKRVKEVWKEIFL
ncbi:hypothetical protein OEA41_004083 [Lepraria neglecta]|uniref:Uncharacterized protein n=1 Tax=Lepraria neglecta TaxID=209136 RepID=A0AAE0DJF4_9LECA|nr:hypothetical protein OEA41_004083 [Lepraria neglecta]